MQKELAQFILQACENSNTFFQDEDSMPELRESYSGRGMFGKETTAIVCSDLMAVMAAIACEIEAVDMYEYREDVDLSDIKDLRTDSMGRGSIVIY